MSKTAAVYEPIGRERLKRERVAAYTNRAPAEFPEVWSDMGLSVFTALTHAIDPPPLTDEQAAELAIAAAQQIGRDLGGQQPYIPSGQKLAVERRNRRMVDAYKGDNIVPVARAEGISERAARRIVNGK